jgi:hypothetical protein
MMTLSASQIGMCIGVLVRLGMCMVRAVQKKSDCGVSATVRAGNS